MHEVIVREGRIIMFDEIISVKYLSDITPLEQKDGGDWIDLRAGERTELKANEHAYIPLGIAMKLPYGFEAVVAPRSSAFKNHGFIVANSIGVIDEAYCGNDDQWMLSVFPTKDTVIEKDERIAQFRIFRHQPKIRFDVVDDLKAESRGGLGSTGKF